MLLLLLSFYVHYDLLNCEENVKAKLSESLPVELHRQKLLQVNALLEDLEQKTRRLSVLLADDPRGEAYALRSVIPRKDQNNQYPKNSTKPAQLLASPINNSFAIAASVISPDPDATLGPRIPRIFFHPLTELNTSIPSSFSDEGPDLISILLSTTPSRFTTASSSIKTTRLGRLAREWLNEIAPYTRVRKKTRSTSIDQSQSSEHSRMTKPTSLSGTESTWQQSSSVSSPGQTPGAPFQNWTTAMSTAGDVLYGKIKVKKPSTTLPLNAPSRYQDLMNQLGEGQLVVFGIEMFRLIAVKNKREVREVLAPVETIYKTSLESSGLVGGDNPFLTIFGNLATMTSKDDIDILRTYSSMMFHTLLKRKEVLSPEVNSIIDQAELIYSDDEGKRLLRSLSEFEDYPDTNKSSYSICNHLVESLLQPLRRPADSESRQKLLSSINLALRQNLPQLLSVRSVGTPTTLSLIGTTISKIETQTIKQNRQHHHHKKNRKRKRRLKPEYYTKNTRHDSQELDYKQPNFITAFTTQRSKQRKRTIKAKLVHLRYNQKPQATHARDASRFQERVRAVGADLSELTYF